MIQRQHLCAALPTRGPRRAKLAERRVKPWHADLQDGVAAVRSRHRRDENLRSSRKRCADGQIPASNQVADGGFELGEPVQALLAARDRLAPNSIRDNDACALLGRSRRQGEPRRDARPAPMNASRAKRYLARRRGAAPPQVDRPLDLRHPSRLDASARTLAALGRALTVTVGRAAWSLYAATTANVLVTMRQPVAIFSSVSTSV